MPKTINVVDLFSGPGGLGEGFSAFQPPRNGEAPGYRIRMSVEMEPNAHRTLSLRALYRLLKGTPGVASYDSYLKGQISREELEAEAGDAWDQANQETLGGPKELGKDNPIIHKELECLKSRHPAESWVLIGGPPCQAYSLAGRSRNKGNKGYLPEKDGRHFLYQEYLEVLSRLQPDVFVMENVKGILTSKVNNSLLFPRILEDLRNPSRATRKKSKKYRIYSFVVAAETGPEHKFQNADFIIRSELFGIPQSRHRVILLGVSEDISRSPDPLPEQSMVAIESVLKGLPPLRSGLTKVNEIRVEDSASAWSKAVDRQAKRILREAKQKRLKELYDLVLASSASIQSENPTESKRKPKPIPKKTPGGLRKWIEDAPPPILLNHSARGHMDTDLGRYLFSACWSKIYGAAPKAQDYLECLEPNHANWKTGKFADRFRTQLEGRPATTITSHISKDGHAFIHYDPTQCRSLTVREAARIQTFPDNYFFEGKPTAQYQQVGNAVPPYLAKQLAAIVWKLLA